MPVTVYKLPDEPIIIAAFTDDITPEVVNDAFHQTAVFLQDEATVLYRISDFRMVHTDGLHLLHLLRAAVTGAPGSSSDKHVKPVLLGVNHWSQMTQAALRDTVTMPIFETMSAALDYVRGEIARAKLRA